MIDSADLHDALNTDLTRPIPESTVSQIISLPPFLPISGVSNFRDLSYENNLRPGYVYRSANLSDITEDGKRMLAEELGVTTIFDLRNESERVKAPAPHIDEIDTVWEPYGAKPATLSLRDFAGDDRGVRGFVKMYSGILEASAPTFHQVFKHIRDQPDDPFVFHCSGTSPLLIGIVSFLLSCFSSFFPPPFPLEDLPRYRTRTRCDGCSSLPI